MVKQRKVEAVDMALILSICAVISAVLTGCGATTGWKVEFGVSPITSVHDEAGLNTGDLKNGNGKGFETLAR